MNTIKVSDEHLQLIQKALELYMRCSIGQFERVLDVSSVQKKCWKLKDDGWDAHYLEQLLKDAHTYYTGTANGGPGIFNEEKVTEDAREAMHIHDQIRHHLWKKGDQKYKHIVAAYAAMVKLIEIE